MDRSQAIRVLIAEDEEPLRRAISDLVAGEPDLEVVAIADSAGSAIEQAGRLTPDVALLDVRMPGGGGVQAARDIAHLSPDTRSIALSAYEDRSNVLEMLRAGAVGYVVKGDSPDEIIDAIRRAARGQGSLSATIIVDLVGDLSRDVTQRAEANEVRRRSEARFRNLLEATPDAVTISAADGRILFLNEPTERLFGYTRGELIGQPIETLLPRHSRDGHQRYLADAFSEPSGRVMETVADFTGLRKDGSEFPVDISLSAIETDDGMLATAFIRNVTARKEGETILRRSEERFETVLELAPDGVVVIDDHGLIVLVNAQAEKLFDYSRADLLGKAIEVILPEWFRRRHAGTHDEYIADLRAKPMGTGLELGGLRRDGAEFPVAIALATIEAETGRQVVVFVRGATERETRAEEVRGIAERRAALARLVSAGEDERGRIAGDIHDDSIQVMTAAGMRLQMLRKSLNDPEQLSRLDELEETIKMSISRLRHLIFELRPPALDNEGLPAALRLYLDEADAASTTTYVLDDQLTYQPSEANRVVLYRITQEVLTNVRKHANAKNASVTLGSRDGGTYVIVRDDGVGFTPDIATARPGHLGLAAVLERAELAGGWLRVDSAEDTGTIVEFWIADEVGQAVSARGAE